MPASRHAESESTGSASATYGDYFTAVSDYLTRDDLAVPAHIVERLTGFPTTPEAISAIDVHLIKHGAFYHPALVTLKTGRLNIPFVLNVATSQAGRSKIRSEAASLEKLYHAHSEHYIPKLFHLGSGQPPSGEAIPMFAVQWLTGFHEFHPTIMDLPGQQWQVWDSDHGPWQLSKAEVADFFHQAVYILTYYFDPYTLSAILDWHNAAGDFIVGKNEGKLEVCLITVRRYEPLLRLDAQEQPSLETLLDALTLFFLRTSLWMRLDRLDGVKDLVWADEYVVAPMWAGFMSGIGKMADENGFPSEFASGVKMYLAAHSPESLYQLGQAMVQRLPHNYPERRLMARHLKTHTELLAGTIQGNEKIS